VEWKACWAVVVLEVTTEGVRTGRGTERWRQRAAVQVAAAAALKL